MILEREFTNSENQVEFLKCLANTAAQVGKCKLIIETRAEQQYQFLEPLHGNIVSERATYRLRITEVNIKMIDTWCNQGPLRAPGVRIERFSVVPEDDLIRFTELYTETWNQAPLEDAAPDMRITPENRRKMEKYFKYQEYIWTTMISREQDGTISGLTEIWYNPKVPHFVEQGLTGVDTRYRGRGLGKWLKAKMLKFVIAEYPDATIVETGNADTNAPMLSINQNMGFRPYRKMWFISFDVNDLLAKLQPEKIGRAHV